ncbi:MAG: PAS domain-containing protein [Pseudomonadota bacterium]|nr:PAS domain-containing protein [Pseudomonadota bacterium]
MLLDAPAAGRLVDQAAMALSSAPDTLFEVLGGLPAPTYAIDCEGTITYFNHACIELAGRTPVCGRDKWCVTWKVYTTDGEFVPHDQCPMAVAIREKRAIRNVEAVARRPDGSTVYLVPFPTPYYDADGNLAGAINLLLDISRHRGPDYLHAQADKCRRLARSIANCTAAEKLDLMATNYDTQATKLTRAAR